MRRFLSLTAFCMLMLSGLALSVLVPLWVAFSLGWPIVGIVAFITMVSAYIATLNVSTGWEWVDPYR